MVLVTKAASKVKRCGASRHSGQIWFYISMSLLSHWVAVGYGLQHVWVYEWRGMIMDYMWGESMLLPHVWAYIWIGRNMVSGRLNKWRALKQKIHWQKIDVMVLHLDVAIIITIFEVDIVFWIMIPSEWFRLACVMRLLFCSLQKSIKIRILSILTALPEN